MTQKDLGISPGAKKSWSLDWADPAQPFLQAGETITAHTVTVTAGITKVSDSLVGSVVTVTVEASAGLREGQRATILISIETSAGRKDSRRIPLTCSFGEIA